MPDINKNQLQSLRNKAQLSQGELAHKARVSPQTIYRIEAGKTAGVRMVTARKIADALKVTVEALAADPTAEPELRQYPFGGLSELRVTISDQARNALDLVSHRYSVPSARMVELAPLLFEWAAQASLRRRAARLNALHARYNDVEAMQGDFPHLSAVATHNWRGEDILEFERRSIGKNDIFGESIPYEGGEVGNSDADEGEDNPFARFLKELASETPGATFTSFRPIAPADYVVCADLAKAMLGDSQEAADAVLAGYVRLQDLPRGVTGSEAGTQRAAWVIDQHTEAMDRFWKDNPLVKQLIDEARADVEGGTQ